MGNYTGCRRFLLSAILFWLLSACGLKGDLHLPPAAEAQAADQEARERADSRTDTRNDTDTGQR